MLQGVQTVATGGRVEYRLARNAVVREFRRGRLSRLDVCDAHPELLRAARNLGRAIADACPICDDQALVDVTFVFGSRLPSGGRCVASAAELARLQAAQGSRRLLRGRGVHRLLVEPPAAHLPGRCRRRLRPLGRAGATGPGGCGAAERPVGLEPGRPLRAGVQAVRPSQPSGTTTTLVAGGAKRRPSAAGSPQSAGRSRRREPCPSPAPLRSPCQSCARQNAGTAIHRW